MSFDLTQLGDYVKVQGGFAYKSKDFLESSKNRVLKIKNIRFGIVDYSDAAYVSDAIAKETRDWKTKEGDVLISMTGSGPNAPQSLVGRVARVWAEDPEALINQRVGRIRLIDEKRIHKDFIFYLLSLPQSQNYLVSNSSGSANQANISGKIIESLPCPKVDYETSKRIASIARGFDEKINLNNKINQTLESISQALFKSWFVDFDPVKAKIEVLEAGGSEEEALIAAMQVISSKNAEELAVFEVEKPEEYAELRATAELFPAAMVESELGEIPEGWGVSSLHEIVDIIYGAPFKSKQFNDLGQGKPLIRIRDLRNERSNLYTEEEHPRGYLVQNGDLLVGMDGEFKPYIWGGGPAWMNQRICCFKPKDNYSTGLIKEIITPLLRQIELTATATTVIHLGKGDIDKFEFIDAGSELLTCFSQVVDNLTQKVVKGKDSNRTLEQLRDTLLPKLLSGELDVSELVDSLEADA